VDERALFALASRQYGLIERSQGLRFGVDDDALGRRVRDGILEREHPGVYRYSAAPRTREQRLLAASLAAGPDSAVSHRSAAHEWGMAEFPDVIEIVTPRAQWPRLRNVRVHRSTDLLADHVTTRRGIAITKPLRTLIDLGQSAPWAVADALELGLAKRLFGIKAADAALDEFSRRGRTGVGVFRRVIDDRALERGIPDGLLEPRMARLMRDHGLPAALFQHWITPAIRVDFAYPHVKIVLEVDGFGSRRTPAALDAGNARQNQLVILGWTVLRFTWKQVIRQPEKVAREILVTLTRAGHEPA
jgi:very-short-patch-repair endonuclease